MKNNSEIDEGSSYIGYGEALDIIKATVRTSGTEEIPVNRCAGRIAAADLTALVTHPLSDVSLKDGFAVKSSDIATAAKNNPVSLRISGSSFAGIVCQGRVNDGEAVKICTGGRLPEGADAVVSDEFCVEGPQGNVLVKADAERGRNVMRAGIEVSAGETIVKKNEKLTPGRLGLAASAGIEKIRVYRKPRVAIISIGDEVVLPGEKLENGQLYASNMITLEGWLTLFGISCVTSLVKDNKKAIIKELNEHLHNVDVILTSGGAWGSERDLVIGVLNDLGWQKLFHYVRMGPGKGIAFGLFKQIPVFCLPGGPTSNQMAFLQIALPAIMRMSGDTAHPLHVVYARLTEDIKGRHGAWTEFKDAVITIDKNGNYSAGLFKSKSRLKSIARADGFICIPEGRDFMSQGDIIPVQLLSPGQAF